MDNLDQKIKDNGNIKGNKVIHYCWYGGKPLSELTKKCIKSWKKYLPDFEIKQWNEKNFDVNQCKFSKQAYEQKKWAFVADYTRFKVLEQYGGLYLDTDMEITADISKFLENDFFVGKEDSNMANAAVVWAKNKQDKHIEEIVKIYENFKKFNPNGDIYEVSVPRILSEYFEKYGFDKKSDQIQILDNKTVYIYPMEYFYPLSYDYQHNKFTKNSCMIHHFDATWASNMEKFKTNLKRKNLKWVVYILDIFISMKNFLVSFLNYMDIAMFITVFVLLNLVALTFMPILSSDKIYIFEGIQKNYLFVIIQTFLIAGIWTYLCKKIKLLEMNKVLDKITDTNIADEEGKKESEIKRPKLTQDQNAFIFYFEWKVYKFEFLLTILFMLTPFIFLNSIIPSKQIIYAFAIVFSFYYFYIGIRKKFKYRILDLLPIAFINSFIAFYIPNYGLIYAIPSFLTTLILILKNKVVKKRIIVYIISTIVFSLGFAIISNLHGNFDINIVNKNLSKINLFNFERIQKYDQYKKYININTQFDAGKKLFGNMMPDITNNNSLLNILYMPTILVYLSIIISVILALVNKNKNYLGFIILTVLNAITINKFKVDSTLYSFTNCLLFYVLLVILIVTYEGKKYKEKAKIML